MTPADIHTAIADLTGRDRLYPRLAQLIPEHDTVLEATIGSHKKHLAPPIPWNEPAAMLYMDIHAGARDHETTLTLLLFGKATFRGGADKLTIEALERLPVLFDAAWDRGLWDRPAVQHAARTTAAWPVQVRRLLDEARPHEVPWTRAPGNLTCPHCSRPLFLPPAWQYAGDQAEVVCRNPECRDEDGARRQWPAGAWLGRLVDDTDDAPTDPADVDPDRLVTARQAADLLGLSTPDTVYVWKHRGKVTPAGTDRAGRDVYRFGDLTALAGERVAS